MEADTRRVIAYIAGKLKLSEACAAVFDHAEQKQFSFSGILTPEHVSIYDFVRKCHVGGKRSPLDEHPDYFSIYDFGNGRHLTLSFEEKTFSGFDHRASKKFSGTISGASITIRDEELEKEFYYSV